MDVGLTHGRSSQLASIFDVEGDRHFAVSRRGQLDIAEVSARLRDICEDLPEAETRIAATKTERESAPWSTGRVEPPVSHIQSFGIDGSDSITEFDVFVVVERDRPGYWKLSTRIAPAKDRIGNSCTALVSTEESLD
jgi:hypothetical protein